MPILRLEMEYFAPAPPCPPAAPVITARRAPVWAGPLPGAQAGPKPDVSGDGTLGPTVAVERRLVDQIEATVGEDPGPGGWSGGFANQAHWDPSRAREWRCWAQSGPTWSAHCGAEVAAVDSLGLCQRHRRSLLEGETPEAVDQAGTGAAVFDPWPEAALSAP